MQERTVYCSVNTVLLKNPLFEAVVFGDAVLQSGMPLWMKARNVLQSTYFAFQKLWYFVFQLFLHSGHKPKDHGSVPQLREENFERSSHRSLLYTKDNYWIFFSCVRHAVEYLAMPLRTGRKRCITVSLYKEQWDRNMRALCYQGRFFQLDVPICTLPTFSYCFGEPLSTLRRFICGQCLLISPTVRYNA